MTRLAFFKAYDVRGKLGEGLNKEIDGISLEFSDWRLSLRASNIEPLLRLNVESLGDSQLVKDRVAEIQTLINESI